MAYADFREYLDRLEKEGELKRISAPFSCKKGSPDLYTLRTYAAEIGGPIPFLENVKGLNTPGVPVMVNVFGAKSQKRIALALEETNWKKALDKHMKVIGDYESWPEPVFVDRKNAPCKDVIIKGGGIDVRKQLPKVWFGIENEAYITAGVVRTRDVEDGSRNLGCYRFGLLEDTDGEGKPISEERQKRYLTAYVRWDQHSSHSAQHYAKARRRGEELEIAIAVMCDPSLHIAGASSPPYGRDEVALAGALRGAPVEVVKCETVDLEVPATAEWVVEGKVLLPEPANMVVDGPHLQNVGYVGYSRFPLMRVTCITHRANPMWFAACSYPKVDHMYLLELATVSDLLSDLQSKIPQVKDLAIYPKPTGWGMTVVQLSVDGQDRPLGLASRVMSAVWGSRHRYGDRQKIVVVVGPDIDPWDLNEVVSALVSRVQPIRDITFRRGQAHQNDPSALGRGTQLTAFFLSEQMGIDATIKVPEYYDRFQQIIPKPTAEERERLKAIIGNWPNP